MYSPVKSTCTMKLTTKRSPRKPMKINQRFVNKDILNQGKLVKTTGYKPMKVDIIVRKRPDSYIKQSSQKSSTQSTPHRGSYGPITKPSPFLTPRRRTSKTPSRTPITRPSPFLTPRRRTSKTLSRTPITRPSPFLTPGRRTLKTPSRTPIMKPSPFLTTARRTSSGQPMEKPLFCKSAPNKKPAVGLPSPLSVTEENSLLNIGVKRAVDFLMSRQDMRKDPISGLFERTTSTYLPGVQKLKDDCEKGYLPEASEENLLRAGMVLLNDIGGLKDPVLPARVWKLDEPSEEELREKLSNKQLRLLGEVIEIIAMCASKYKVKNFGYPQIARKAAPALTKETDAEDARPTIVYLMRNYETLFPDTYFSPSL